MTHSLWRIDRAFGRISLLTIFAWALAGCGAHNATTAATFDVNLSASGTGSGTITASSGGLACSYTPDGKTGNCLAGYADGSAVTLTAVASTGSQFTGWSGACSGVASTCEVTVAASLNVQAAFTALQQHLAVTGTGSGAGSVSSQPSGIACAVAASALTGSCTSSFSPASSVVLSATPSAGSVFDSWTGDCSGSNPACTIVADQSRAVTARFLLLRNVAVTATSTGSGSVTSVPAGLLCTIANGVAGAGCTAASFADGKSVTLTALADAGSSFAGWSGACTGLTPTCTLSAVAATTVSAAFVALRTLTVAGSGAGAGTVSSVPAGISCSIGAGIVSGSCLFDFPDATTITLAAIPTTGSIFSGWSGACTGTGSCSLTMSAARTATASFSGASSASTTSVTAAPASITAGGAPSIVTITVRDAASHPVSGATVTMAVASGAALSITQPATVTNASGITTASVSGTIAGARSLVATVNGSIAAAQQPAVLVTAGAAALMSPSGVFATSGAHFGSAVSTPPAVLVTDAFGNLVAGSGVSFTVTKGFSTVSNGTTSGSAVTVLTDATGVARLSSWTLGSVSAAGNYNALIDVNNRVTASVGGTAGGPLDFSTAVAVSYASDVQTIWSAGGASSCTSAGCHITGGSAPVLVAATSRATLAGNSAYWTPGDSLSASNSSNRLLYRLTIGAPLMPQGFTHLPANILSIVKAYIVQGAPNN